MYIASNYKTYLCWKAHSLVMHFYVPQEANNLKSAGIKLMVAGVGDIVDFQFLSSLSDKSWPTFNPAIQQEIESTIDSENNINNKKKDVDLCIILDNSASVREQDFILAKDAMRNLTKSLGIKNTVSITIHVTCIYVAIKLQH